MFFRRRYKSRHNDAGFSLLELTVGLFVVSMGMFGVFTVYHAGLKQVRAAQENAAVLRALENELETLRAAPFASLTSGTGQPFRSVSPELERLVGAKAETAIAAVATLENRLREVEVHLTWRGQDGRLISKSLHTFIAATGGSDR